MTRLLPCALLACGAPTAPPTVTVTTPSSTPQARVAVPNPLQAFLDAGCTEKGATLDCAGAKIEGVDACRWGLRKVDVKLEPPALVMECQADPRKVPSALYTTGCMLTSSVIDFVATKKGIVRIASAKELAAMFAPVTTADEAVAFAQLETGHERFDEPITADDGTPLRTNAYSDADGAFHFELFQHQTCGCEHPVRAISYRVDRIGTVTEVSRTVVLENPAQSGMCKD